VADDGDVRSGRPDQSIVARLYEGNSDTDIRFVILAPARPWRLKFAAPSGSS
jgi:hypothetical protein